MSFGMNKSTLPKLRSKLSLVSLRKDNDSKREEDHKTVKITLNAVKEAGTTSADSSKSPRQSNRPSLEVTGHAGGQSESTFIPDRQAPSVASKVSLMSRQTFRKALDDPVGLHKFGQFLASELGAEALCFWLNAEQYRSDMLRLQSLGRRIHDLHVPTNAPLAVNVSCSERNLLVDDLNSFFSLPDPFARASEAAFVSMHVDGWHRFVKHRLSLAQNQSMRVDAKKGFIDSFCLADCQAGEDQPIVMVSKGFEALTGYGPEQSLGANCRFMQGPGTSKTALERVRHACQMGLPSQELLLNYHKNGAPMWVLLRIEPLRDRNGVLKYLMGHQFIISKRATDLTYLLSDELDDEPSQKMPGDASLAALHAKEAQNVTNSYISAQSARISNPTDRDRRLKDATALAFDAQTIRPKSSAGKAGIALSASASRGSPAVGSRAPKAGRPTSAGGGRLSSFGSAAKEERRALSELAQIDAEEELGWQSQVLARFVLLDPKTHAIQFSSLALPSEFAQGCNFLSIVEKTNASDVVKHIKRALGDKESTNATIKLHIYKEDQAKIPGGQEVSLVITPLLDTRDKVAGIIVLLTV